LGWHRSGCTLNAARTQTSSTPASLKPSRT